MQCQCELSLFRPTVWYELFGLLCLNTRLFGPRITPGWDAHILMCLRNDGVDTGFLVPRWMENLIFSASGMPLQETTQNI
jgi:hypothetical protein